MLLLSRGTPLYGDAAAGLAAAEQVQVLHLTVLFVPCQQQLHFLWVNGCIRQHGAQLLYHTALKCKLRLQRCY
jgi:hypothetical protein